jgi:hypothetical protein
MKPKRLPRLWCARQGLLPLELNDGSTLGRALVRTEPVDQRETCAEKISAAEHAPPTATIAWPNER